MPSQNDLTNLRRLAQLNALYSRQPAYWTDINGPNDINCNCPPPHPHPHPHPHPPCPSPPPPPPHCHSNSNNNPIVQYVPVYYGGDNDCLPSSNNSTGYTGTCGPIVSCGPNSIQGPTGPQGIPGPTGPAGQSGNNNSDNSSQSFLIKAYYLVNSGSPPNTEVESVAYPTPILVDVVHNLPPSFTVYFDDNTSLILDTTGATANDNPDNIGGNIYIKNNNISITKPYTFSTGSEIQFAVTNSSLNIDENQNTINPFITWHYNQTWANKVITDKNIVEDFFITGTNKSISPVVVSLPHSSTNYTLTSIASGSPSLLLNNVLNQTYNYNSIPEGSINPVSLNNPFNVIKFDLTYPPTPAELYDICVNTTGPKAELGSNETGGRNTYLNLVNLHITFPSNIC